MRLLLAKISYMFAFYFGGHEWVTHPMTLRKAWRLTKCLNIDDKYTEKTFQESYKDWRKSINQRHWDMFYVVMPNTLSEDAFTAGYKEGMKKVWRFK